jgi:hypothetical protein
MTAVGVSSLFAPCCRAVAGIALLAFVLTGCTTPTVKPQVWEVDAATAKRLEGAWVAVVGDDRAFTFNGEFRDSKAQYGYQMLYPAPNLVGFLAGVATHAALQSAQNDAHIEAQRKASDEILAPYRQVLGEILVHDAFRSALGMSESGAGIDVVDALSENTALEVYLAAHAIMAQSRQALIVDLVAKVKNTSTPEDNAEYVHKVRVISDPVVVNDDSINNYWLADDGRQLKQTVTSLLARAIDLFMADATRHLRPLSDKPITARYQFGDEHRTERAVLLEQSCARQTLRTLRGWVLSVPVPESLKAEARCKDTEIATHSEVPSA